MARILLGSTVAEIRGSQGGTTYSRNRFGNYTRNKTTPVNPRSTAQTVARTVFGGLSRSWSTLTELERQTWLEASASGNYAKTNNFGLSYNPTGFNLFVGINSTLIRLGEALVNEAPSHQVAQIILTIARIGSPVTAASYPVDIMFSDNQSEPPIGTLLLVEATMPKPEGVNFVSPNEFQEIVNSNDVTFGTGSNLLDYYEVRFGRLPAAGEKIFFRVRTVNLSNGVYSPGIEFSQVRP